MEHYNSTKEHSERNIGHNQVQYDVAEQSSVALVALEIVGISRDKVAVLTVSTQSSFTIEIATELLVLPGNILIHFVVETNHSFSCLTMALSIEAATNDRFI